MQPIQMFVVLFGVGVIITTLVFVLVLRGRLSVNVQVEKTDATPLTMDGIRAVTAFAKEQHERIGNYMQANWSGSPEQLPSVLERLIASIEQDARAKDIPADRDMIKSVVEASLRAHKLAKGGEVREALKKVA